MTVVRYLFVACIIAIAGPAHAQSVEADVLFSDGKKLMKEGKIAEACERFEASERLESSTGTLLNLADCREKNRQTATAWALFRKAAGAAKVAGDQKRAAEAARREHLLEPRLSYLTISVPVTSNVRGLAIARNGIAVDSAVWNQRVPVDPGPQDVVAIAPGRLRWSKRVEVEEPGQEATLSVPMLQDASSTTVTAPGGGTTTTPTSAATGGAATAGSKPDDDDDGTTAPTRTRGRFTTMRRIAVGLGAVGVVGLATGVVFGMKGLSEDRTASEICPNTACGDLRAVELSADARDHGRYANVGFAVGGGAIVAAAVLWFVGAPSPASGDVAVSAIVSSSQLGLGLGGSF